MNEKMDEVMKGIYEKLTDEHSGLTTINIHFISSMKVPRPPFSLSQQ